ncbi:MAG: DUF5752 family protein [Candidatus Omnitrophota bacterium]|nr:DUF5752 family protein [Candidatus Omnitrophota bacterium]
MVKTEQDKSFRFYTRLHLRILTGLKATNIEQLLVLLKKVTGSCIYYHTHHFLQVHEKLSPEPPNDFAYWIRDVLNEEALAEKIASIDIVKFHAISHLRKAIVKIVEDNVKENPRIKSRFASHDKAFHFIKSTSFVMPTPYVAKDLKSFHEILQKVTVDALYFHLFEAKLRLDKETNDFSFWLGTSLKEVELAEKIASLDPYTFTMEDLREELIKLVKEKL